MIKIINNDEKAERDPANLGTNAAKSVSHGSRR